VRLNASIGISYDLGEAVGEAPTATRGGACAPRATQFVELGSGWVLRYCLAIWWGNLCFLVRSNPVKVNQTKSNQIKPNQSLCKFVSAGDDDVTGELTATMTKGLGMGHCDASILDK
jgi:hypothetical protein